MKSMVEGGSLATKQKKHGKCRKYPNFGVLVA